MVRFAAALIALAVSLVGVRANAQQQQILLLDFWSPHCGPCMQMKPVVHSFEQAGYPIRAVDTTRNGQLSSQYNVSGIPCFVMLVNGREFERQVGATSSESLQQMFERAKDEVRRQGGVRTQSPIQQPTNQSAPTAREIVAGPEPQPVAVQTTELTRPARQSPASDRPGYGSNPPANSAPGAHGNLLSATVRLIVEDAQGRSYGTGTIVDTRKGEALIVTCGHLFRESQGKSPVKVDLFEAAGDGVRVAGQATGQVISYDLNRDVALVSVRPDRTVKVAAIAPPRTKIEKGDRAVGIGCGNGKDPTILETRVTSVDRYQGPPNIEATGAPEIGRSGGGLFNANDQLIGICNNADTEGNEGIYAGLESIQQELDRLGLKEIYAKSDAGGPLAGNSLAASSAAGPSIVRGQELPITPLPSDSTAAVGPGSASSATAKAPAGHQLSKNEQAALEEIVSRAVTSEVVCIVRPKEPGGQSEVITLEDVSPEFLRALRENQRPATMNR